MTKDFRFGKLSERRLEGVHTDLICVMRHALEISTVDFSIVEGVRTLARQKKLLAAGATTTLNSRHLTGHAVDIAPYVAGSIRWDWPLFYILAAYVKEAAAAENVKIEWGGDWKTFKDGPHWQLSWREYKP